MRPVERWESAEYTIADDPFGLEDDLGKAARQLDPWAYQTAYKAEPGHGSEAEEPYSDLASLDKEVSDLVLPGCYCSLYLF